VLRPLRFNRYNGGAMALNGILVILQLIYLEGILSLDNAAVLATMVAHLPRSEPIPWPGVLRSLQRPAHRVLGGQRAAALKVGLIGAYLGRGFMLIAATAVIHNRWLMLLGGLFLIKLAADFLADPSTSELSPTLKGASVPRRSVQRSFWSVVLAVELADLVFSFDNVVAAVGLSRDIRVVLIGVGLGILLMRFASGMFGYLIDRYPVLEAATYIIVLLIGFEVCVEELLRVQIADWVKFLVTVGTVVFSLWYAHRVGLQRVLRPLMPLRRVFAVINLIVVYPLRLLAWLSTAALAGLRVIMLLATVRPRQAPPKR